jgi:hypothetical protein
MLYILGALNPNASLTGGRWLNIFLGGKATLLILFGQHSAESAKCFNAFKRTHPYPVTLLPIGLSYF